MHSLGDRSWVNNSWDVSVDPGQVNSKIIIFWLWKYTYALCQNVSLLRRTNTKPNEIKSVKNMGCHKVNFLLGTTFVQFSKDILTNLS